MSKRTRDHARRTNGIISPMDPGLILKRTRRHLNELERSNHSESTTIVDNEETEQDAGTQARRGHARQTISDKRTLNIPGDSPASGKRKSTMAVRTALLYRKHLNTLLEESGIAKLPPNTPTYLTALAPPSRYPPRTMCSVCGYWGRYKCQRCSMAYCDSNCEGIHAETRCERRVV